MTTKIQHAESGSAMQQAIDVAETVRNTVLTLHYVLTRKPASADYAQKGAGSSAIQRCVVWMSMPCFARWTKPISRQVM